MSNIAIMTTNNGAMVPETTLTSSAVQEQPVLAPPTSDALAPPWSDGDTKRKKTDRLKTCPECGLKAGSNRQLKCRGCEHVYRVSERNKKRRLVVPEPSPVPLGHVLGDDWSFEELDEIFKGFGDEVAPPLDHIGENFFDEPWKTQTKGICV